MAVLVGASEDRTRFKHLIFKADLGRICGVLRNARPARIPVVRSLHVIDLCAGDGAPSVFSEYSSPGIIARHFDHGDFKRHVIARATLYEKAPGTFLKLQKAFGHREDFSLIHDDASSFRVSACPLNQAVYVYADPNALSQIPINGGMIDSFTPYTTFMATLGCNVGGVKRMTLEQRARFIGVVERLGRDIPTFHDCILVWVKRDAAQWAYLIRTPRAWSEKSQALFLKKGNEMFTAGVGVVSRRGSTAHEWDGEIARLMLTAKERTDV